MERDIPSDVLGARRCVLAEGSVHNGNNMNNERMTRITEKYENEYALLLIIN